MDAERLGSTRRKKPTGAWPWPGRLPDGPMILEGRGGLGKSTLTADLAARVSRGLAWPDGTRASRKPGGVLIFGHEDRREVMEHRISVAGGDLTKVIRIAKANVAGEWDEFERLVKQENVKLIVMDPAVTFLGVDLKNEDSTRWILEQLDVLCEKYGVCCILIRHMRKDANDQDPMEDGGRGTGALRNYVRVVYRLILDPDDEKRRLFMATKFNYGEFPPTLVFRTGDDKGNNRLLWDKEPSRWNSFNLVARPKDEVRRTESRECLEWMKEYFQKNHFRMKAKTVIQAGEKQGFSASTIKRCRVVLNVRTQKLEVFQGEWLWTHPLYDPDREPELHPEKFPDYDPDVDSPLLHAT